MVVVAGICSFISSTHMPPNNIEVYYWGILNYFSKKPKPKTGILVQMVY